MKRMKAIALDLDGTLLTSDKKISQATKETIQVAKDLGIKIILCTGRPLKGILHYLEELELVDDTDFSITYNGGLIQENKSGNVHYQKTLSKEEVSHIYQETYSVGLPINMIDLDYAYETTYPAGVQSYYPQIMEILSFLKKNPDDFEDNHRFNKAVICTDQELLDQQAQQLPAEFFDSYTTVKSRPILLEVLPKGVSKGDALVRLADLLGISMDEMMACGDEENDLSMIEAAGFGVAMENAIDSLKEAADYITASNNHDGVAQAINYMIFESEY
ncbi:Cof-type HAD-IIB family hydrolase [Granulicatella seriolae]|uniref:Cof-type HAD-IIB family hydrolase n=1 Tax=Granulicatella seriolae TaxID=2967226 RepID=A0ABT1WMT0_9LACT|nr:Cof-type HAD-IIB family hydrolase [Granulicatella seriolae]